MTITKTEALNVVEKWANSQPIPGWRVESAYSGTLRITNKTIVTPATVVLELVIVIVNDQVTLLPNLQRRYDAHLYRAAMYLDGKQMKLLSQPFDQLVRTDHFATFMRKLNQVGHLVSAWAVAYEPELVNRAVLLVL